MTSTGARIEAVAQELDRALGRLREVALAAGPRSLDDWNALLARVQLVPSSSAERLQRYQSLQLSRGALPDEYRAAVQVAARQAVGCLAEIKQSDPDGTGHHGSHGSDVGVLHARLQDLVAREGAAYEALLRPQKPGGGLGGIFARARATSAIDPWKVENWAGTVTLSCVSCGAPQGVELDFRCHYCGKALFRRGIGWD